MQNPTIVDHSAAQILADAPPEQLVVVPRISNFNSAGLADDSGKNRYLRKVTCALLAFMSIGYGGIQAAAWNFEFPTEIESYVWKVCSFVVLAGSIPYSFLLYFAAPVFTSYGPSGFGLDSLRNWRKMLDKESSNCFISTLLVFSLISVPFFCCARVTLLLESFISLRHVPEGAYVTLRWTDYFPHL